MSLGDTARGRDIGKARKSNLYIYARCPVCKLERWVDYFNWKKSNIDGNLYCNVCQARKQGRINSAKRKAGKQR